VNNYDLAREILNEWCITPSEKHWVKTSTDIELAAWIWGTYNKTVSEFIGI